MQKKTKNIKTPAAIALLAFTILLSAFQFGGGFTIAGHIEGIPAGTVYLSYPKGTAQITDSAKITNGDFVFKGSLTEPVMLVLKTNKSKSQLYFFGDNSAISIKAHKDSSNTAQVNGSIPQNDWKAYLKDYKTVVNYAGGYYHKSDSVYKQFNNKPDSSAKQYLKAENAKLTELDFKVHKEFFAAHPSSIVCAYVVSSHFIPYFQFEQARTLFALLDPAVQKSYYGRQIEESFAVEKRSGIGAKPTFKMADVNGKTVDLASFRGKYVLVDFWASWCAPCRRENPNVLANYKKYHDQGFEVLGVSLDSKKEPWLKAIEADGLVWTHVSDLKGWNNAAALEFGVHVVPSNFLLDRDGKVIAKNIREEALGNKLKSIFN
ncbi:Peroxiredoxin [Pedobacter westerhofensis]|uniref:Peroxiredoxin n=1 Tax=Pedobacter westerhofensis TaxID=425512 RepID=A0A521FDV0_9SPHI|nr:TlpA disulfide reductase family protein [Pedobacter westerhofensis]SMO94382.1 Peroxiredoxin [Pedobacter westerhofensis]